jgi:hypothetical protein
MNDPLYSGTCSGCGRAGHPGTSCHEATIALDLTPYATRKQCQCGNPVCFTVTVHKDPEAFTNNDAPELSRRLREALSRIGVLEELHHQQETLQASTEAKLREAKILIAPISRQLEEMTEVLGSVAAERDRLAKRADIWDQARKELKAVVWRLETELK